MAELRPGAFAQSGVKSRKSSFRNALAALRQLAGFSVSKSSIQQGDDISNDPYPTQTAPIDEFYSKTLDIETYNQYLNEYNQKSSNKYDMSPLPQHQTLKGSSNEVNTSNEESKPQTASSKHDIKETSHDKLISLDTTHPRSQVTTPIGMNSKVLLHDGSSRASTPIYSPVQGRGERPSIHFMYSPSNPSQDHTSIKPHRKSDPLSEDSTYFYREEFEEYEDDFLEESTAIDKALNSLDDNILVQEGIRKDIDRNVSSNTIKEESDAVQELKCYSPIKRVEISKSTDMISEETSDKESVREILTPEAAIEAVSGDSETSSAIKTSDPDEIHDPIDEDKYDESYSSDNFIENSIDIKNTLGNKQESSSSMSRTSKPSNFLTHRVQENTKPRKDLKVASSPSLVPQIPDNSSGQSSSSRLSADKFVSHNQISNTDLVDELIKCTSNVTYQYPTLPYIHGANVSIDWKVSQNLCYANSRFESRPGHPSDVLAAQNESRLYHTTKKKIYSHSKKVKMISEDLLSGEVIAWRRKQYSHALNRYKRQAKEDQRAISQGHVKRRPSKSKLNRRIPQAKSQRHPSLPKIQYRYDEKTGLFSKYEQEAVRESRLEQYRVMRQERGMEIATTIINARQNLEEYDKQQQIKQQRLMDDILVQRRQREEDIEYRSAKMKLAADISSKEINFVREKNEFISEGLSRGVDVVIPVPVYEPRSLSPKKSTKTYDISGHCMESNYKLLPTTSTQRYIQRIYFESGRNVIGPPVKLPPSQSPGMKPHRRYYHPRDVPTHNSKQFRLYSDQQRSYPHRNRSYIPSDMLFAVPENDIEEDAKYSNHDTKSPASHSAEDGLDRNDRSVGIQSADRKQDIILQSKQKNSSNGAMITEEVSHVSSSSYLEYGDDFDEESDHGIEQGSPLRQFYGASLIDYNRPCKAIDECSYSISSEGSHRGSTSSSDVSYKIQVIDWRSNDSEDDTAENNDPPSNGKDQTPDDKEVAQRRRPLPGRTYRAST